MIKNTGASAEPSGPLGTSPEPASSLGHTASVPCAACCDCGKPVNASEDALRLMERRPSIGIICSECFRAMDLM